MGLKKVLETVKKNPPLTLTNCVGGEKIDVDTLQGYSKQNVYSGKNLLENTATTKTVNGVTFTVENGIVTAKGVATANAVLSINCNLTIDESFKIVGCPSNGSSTTYAMNIQADGTWGKSDIGDGYVHNGGGTVATVNITIYSGQTVNNLVFKPMICTDTSLTYNDYEPYVGGIPAPNPQYPQEIKSCGDMGLVDLGSLSWAYYSDFGFRTNNCPKGIKAGVNSVVSNILCTKYIADTATNIINSVKENTIGIGAQKYVYVCDKSYTDATTFKNAMSGVYLAYELADGATADTYGLTFVESGKNLFDDNNTISGKLFDDNGNLTNNANSYISDYIRVNGNANYTLSFNRIEEGIVVRVFDYDSSQNVISRLVKDTDQTVGVKSNTFITSSNAKYIRFCMFVNNTNVQLEQGTESTTYTPYQGQVINLSLNAPLRSIGDIKDEIITDEEGVKKIVRRIGSKDLSTLNWTYNSNVKIFVCEDNIGVLGTSRTTMLCDTYKAVDNVGGVADAYKRGNNTICGYNSSAYKRLYIRNDDCTTVSQLLATLTQTLFLYELATPTTEELTTSQKTELDKLVSFEDTTYFSVDSGLLTIKYYAYKNVFWENPKTNWQSTDYINYIDYERIKDNVIYIGGMARSMYANIPSEIEMPSKQSYSAIPYASDWNAIENNIDNINRGSLKMDIGITKVFQANGFFINYKELNRVENATDMLHEALKINYDLLPKLSYRLGSPKFKF